MDTRALALVAMMMSPVAVTATEPLYGAVADYVGVPAPILYAMSQAESGQLKDGRFEPWPWTLNVAGTAKRYADRQAMFEGLMAALGAGQMMIDVGPMQLNWYWQYHVMGSPWRITDPAVNLKIGAEILKTHYMRCGDWWEAVGRYHRPADGPHDRLIADKYRGRVRHFYNKANPGEANVDAA
jgi:soluble lytic murein transglycosylase-like protein